MDDIHTPNGEEEVDDDGRNLTQRRLDDEGTEDAPVDVGWDDEETGGTGADDGGPGSHNM